MQIWWGPAQPFARNEGQPSKTGVKIVILKVQMQAWHESQTAITVENCDFLMSDANVQELV